MSAIDHLLSVATAYAEAEGIGLSTVSWRVFSDTKKLAAIQHGADIQVRRCERAMMWFSQNWPAGTHWPADVPRPVPPPPGDEGHRAAPAPPAAAPAGGALPDAEAMR